MAKNIQLMQTKAGKKEHQNKNREDKQQPNGKMVNLNPTTEIITLHVNEMSAKIDFKT